MLLFFYISIMNIPAQQLNGYPHSMFGKSFFQPKHAMNLNWPVLWM